MNYLTDDVLAFLWEPHDTDGHWLALVERALLALTTGDLADLDKARLVWLREEMEHPLQFPLLLTREGPLQPVALTYLAALLVEHLARRLTAEGGAAGEQLVWVSLPAELHPHSGGQVEISDLFGFCPEIDLALRQRNVAEAQKHARAALDVVIACADHIRTPFWVQRGEEFRGFRPLLDFDTAQAQAALTAAHAAFEQGNERRSAAT